MWYVIVGDRCVQVHESREAAQQHADAEGGRVERAARRRR